MSDEIKIKGFIDIMLGPNHEAYVNINHFAEAIAKSSIDKEGILRILKSMAEGALEIKQRTLN